LENLIRNDTALIGRENPDGPAKAYVNEIAPVISCRGPGMRLGASVQRRPIFLIRMT
jgi:hypothetical protein